MNIVEFNFPKEMEEILTILSSNNVNYWLFGGSVRDLFTKMISIPNCERGFKLLDKVGILGKEFPILGCRLENGLINFDALRYINDNVCEENATSETDDRTILQFLNIFECEKQNINKFYFYNECKQHISKILQLAVHYNRFLGNLSVNDIDKLMINQHIKSKYRRAVLRIILELKDIKSIVKKNNETKLNPEK